MSGLGHSPLLKVILKRDETYISNSVLGHTGVLFDLTVLDYVIVTPLTNH
jgi:hypothetical protein